MSRFSMQQINNFFDYPNTDDTEELVDRLYCRCMPTMLKILPKISDVAEMINEKTTN